jgi:hypothetical protein
MVVVEREESNNELSIAYILVLAVNKSAQNNESQESPAMSSQTSFNKKRGYLPARVCCRQ